MLTVNFSRAPLPKDGLVVDIGCGFGRHAFEVARRSGSVLAVDAAYDEVSSVRAMFVAMRSEHEILDTVFAEVAEGDACALPLPASSTAYLIASEILEHVPHDEAALAEFGRVCREGATLAVTVPRWGPERINWWLSHEYHSVPGGHIRIYRRRVLERRIREAGFRVVGHHYAHALHTPYWWLKCLVGTTNDRHWAVRTYHRLLVWQIMKNPVLLRAVDGLLNPLIGKSLVVYAVRERATHA